MNIKVIKNCTICNEKIMLYNWQEICPECSKKKREKNEEFLSI